MIELLIRLLRRLHALSILPSDDSRSFVTQRILYRMWKESSISTLLSLSGPRLDERLLSLSKPDRSPANNVPIYKKDFFVHFLGDLLKLICLPANFGDAIVGLMENEYTMEITPP